MIKKSCLMAVIYSIAFNSNALTINNTFKTGDLPDYFHMWHVDGLAGPDLVDKYDTEDLGYLMEELTIQTIESASGLWEKAIRDDKEIDITWEFDSVSQSDGLVSGKSNKLTGNIQISNNMKYKGEDIYFSLSAFTDGHSPWGSLLQETFEHDGKQIIKRGSVSGPGLLKDGTGQENPDFDYSELNNTVDLYSTALHEIGHQLTTYWWGTNSWGLDTVYDNDIDIEEGLPLGGASIDCANICGDHHINDDQTALGGGPAPGQRKLLTATDIAVIAQTSGYTDIWLPTIDIHSGKQVSVFDYNYEQYMNNQYKWVKWDAKDVPEPSIYALMIAGFMALWIFRNGSNHSLSQS